MQTNKTRSATPLDECRVYVGTYGKYNNGSIFGKWVELSDFDSDTDLAHEYVESTGLLHGMPETVERYFDYEAFGRDFAFDFMEFNGYYFSNY